MSDLEARLQQLGELGEALTTYNSVRAVVPVCFHVTNYSRVLTGMGGPALDEISTLAAALVPAYEHMQIIQPNMTCFSHTVLGAGGSAPQWDECTGSCHYTLRLHT